MKPPKLLYATVETDPNDFDNEVTILAAKDPLEIANDDGSATTIHVYEYKESLSAEKTVVLKPLKKEIK